MTRIAPTGNISLYVAPPSTYPGGISGAYWYNAGSPISAVAGDDVLGDGTAAHPFATPQRAVNECYWRYDWCGGGVYCAPTINLGCKPGSGLGYFYPRVKMSGWMTGRGSAMRRSF